MEDSDAEMLKASATLHAIGMAIGFRDYNNHSHYLIKVAFHPIISQCENALFRKLNKWCGSLLSSNGDIVFFFLVLFLCEVKCRTMTSVKYSCNTNTTHSFIFSVVILSF